MSLTLKKLFYDARTFHGWTSKPVGDNLLQELYEALRWAPTCVNGAPLRILFVKDTSEKEKLITTLLPKNVEKTRAAPATAILCEDLRWYENLPHLMPHADYYAHFAGDQKLAEKTSFRNSSIQGGYFILAARAIGLDCGPMSGFDNEKLDSLFLKGTQWRSNFLCNLGYGETNGLFSRLPRLGFEEACRIL